MAMQQIARNATSRRSILVAAVSAVGALVAAPIGQASRVLAADPNDVVLGSDNTATTSTRITGTGENLSAIVGIGGPGAAGVYGESVTLVGGDAGANDFTAGVRGHSTSWTAVLGTSDYGRGVVGQGRIGVEGSGDAIGVGAGSSAGYGLDADTLTGTAIRATSYGSGTALRVIGPARFSTSGLATIRAGHASVTVNPHVDVTPSSKVLATLQTTAGGGVAVRRVARSTSTNRIVIYLTGPAHQTCSVAWFVIS